MKSKKSIVYRGSVIFPKHPKNFLKDSIEGVRKWFDGEIIVSTWKGQESHLININDIDKIILTDDPGFGPIQQINRQVISYTKGIEVSTGDEILVTRTDMCHDINIFDYLYLNTNKNKNLNVFNHKLVTGNMMTISPYSNEVVRDFRISDWFQCGTKEDIYKWGDIMGVLSLENIYGLECTEQIWSLCVLKKMFGNDIDLKNISNIKRFSWDYIINNFDIYNTKTTLKTINMNWDFQPEFIDCYLTEKDYKIMYNKLT